MSKYALDHHLELRGADIDAFLAHCADPSWWTQTIAFTAVHGRAPEG